MLVEAVISDGADSRTTIAALSVNSAAAFRLVVFLTGIRVSNHHSAFVCESVGIAAWGMFHPPHLDYITVSRHSRN